MTGADPAGPGRPAAYRGVGGIAGLFGVGPRTVSQWLIRYGPDRPADELAVAPAYPVPDVELHPGRNGVPDRGWAPDRDPEWRAWKASLPGSRKGIPNRKTAGS